MKFYNMKLEQLTIRKTDRTVSIRPNLQPAANGDKKHVAFYVRGRYYKSRKADNLYNSQNPNPKLPKGPWERIMESDFECGDIPCFVIDRGVDLEIIVE